MPKAGLQQFVRDRHISGVVAKIISNFQAPNKLQIPITKPIGLEFGVWNLFGSWRLELGGFLLTPSAKVVAAVKSIVMVVPVVAFPSETYARLRNLDNDPDRIATAMRFDRLHFSDP